MFHCKKHLGSNIFRHVLQVLASRSFSSFSLNVSADRVLLVDGKGVHFL